MKRPIRILIADDHAIVRMGLASLIAGCDDMTVVGDADDGDAAIRLATSLRPDVVIMDLVMPETDGIEATSGIKIVLPECRILILTTFGTSDDLNRALAAGADGAVFKNAANAELLAAIRRVADGQRAISPHVSHPISDDPPAPRFTERQLEILNAVGRGLSNPEIAGICGIRSDSVRDHLAVIYEKLGAANRVEAVAIAIRKHLLKP